MKTEQLAFEDIPEDSPTPWWFARWFKTDECREDDILDKPRGGEEICDTE